MLTFSCDTESLRIIAKDALRVIPTRTVEAKFYCFRIEVDANSLTLWAMLPGEAVYRNTLNGVVITEGEPRGFLVNAARLCSLLQGVDAKIVTISVNGDTVTIRARPGRWDYKVEQVAYHPAANWPGDAAGIRAEVSPKWLAMALRSAVLCADGKHQKAMYRGVNLIANPGNSTLRVVGTDGTQVSLCETTMNYLILSEAPTHRAIYSHTANLLSQSIDPEGPVVGIGIYSSGIVFTQGDRRIFCQGIPTYTGPLDTLVERGTSNSDFTICAQEWLSLLRQALICSEDKTVQISLDEFYFEIEALRPGAAMTAKTPSSFTGSPRRIAFNGRMLMNFMEMVGDQEVTWNGTVDDGPQIFSVNDTELRFVIMPLVAAK